jgi:hypothetical protein
MKVGDDAPGFRKCIPDSPLTLLRVGADEIQRVRQAGKVFNTSLFRALYSV